MLKHQRTKIELETLCAQVVKKNEVLIISLKNPITEQDKSRLADWLYKKFPDIGVLITDKTEADFYILGNETENE